MSSFDSEPLSDTEKQAIQAFRSQLSEDDATICIDDACAARFLRARECKIPAALEMFRNYCKWFREFQPMSITHTETNIIEQLKTGKAYLGGVDLAGRPILTVAVRLHDPKKFNTEDSTRFAVWGCCDLLRRMENGVDQFCIIFDFGDLAMKNLDVGLCKNVVNILQNCYPERLGQAIILNAGFVFSFLWGIVSAILSARTTRKIVVHKTCTPEILAQYIDPDQIPMMIKNGGGRLAVPSHIREAWKMEENADIPDLIQEAGPSSSS